MGGARTPLVHSRRETLWNALIILYTLLVELEFLLIQVLQNLRSENMQLSNVPEHFALRTSATRWLPFGQKKITFNSRRTRNIISVFYLQISSEIKFIEAGFYVNVSDCCALRSILQSSHIFKFIFCNLILKIKSTL